MSNQCRINKDSTSIRRKIDKDLTSNKSAYMTQSADSFVSWFKWLIIIFIYIIKNKLIKLKYKSFFFLPDRLAFFPKKFL